MSEKDPWNPRFVGLPSFLRLAPTITFSSFSDEPWDAWARDIARPYQIVALPSYRRPADLALGCQDTMWTDDAPAEPRVVWDGFSPIALFEVITECFDYAGPGRLVVRNAETGSIVEDVRDQAFLAARPRRSVDLDYRSLDRHHAALRRWSDAGDCFMTACLYNPHSYKSLPDVQRRASWWLRRGMTAEARDAAWRVYHAEIAAGQTVRPVHAVPIDVAGRVAGFDVEKRHAEMAIEAAEIYGDEPMPDLPPRPAYERSLLARLGIFRRS